MTPLANIPARRRIKTELPPEARPLRILPTPTQEPVHVTDETVTYETLPPAGDARETPVLSSQTAQPQDPVRAPKTWTAELGELQRFFKAVTPPPGPLYLNAWTRIEQPRQFIEAHLSALSAYNGNPHFLPFLDRLRALRDMLAPEDANDIFQ